MVLTLTLCLLGGSALLLSATPGAQAAWCLFPSVRYGRVSPRRYHHRLWDTVTVTCNPGYTLRGSPRSICGVGSRWTPPLPECKKEVTCPRPPNIANGLHSAQSLHRFPQGLTVSYSCKEGFELLGNVSITCTDSGLWSRPLPRCEAIGCQAPEVQNGKVHNPQSTYRAGETLHFGCDAGYTTEGSDGARCQPGGTWDPPLLVCQRVRPCPMPPEVANGNHNSQDKAFFTMGMSVRYSCNPGYYLVGNAAVFCRASGNWSQPRPRCEVTVCINPIVANARQLGGQGLLSAPGQTVTFQCHDGYSLQGSASVSCQEDGSWQPPAPVCDRALPHHNSFNRSSGACAAPKRLQFAELNEEHRNALEFSVGKTVQYTCRPGYAKVPRMSPTVTCLESGVWSEALEFCKRKQCKQPEPPRNGRVVVLTDLLFGSTISHTCDEGYRLVGQSHRRCETLGRDVAWSGLPPICQRVVCPAPEIPNGRVTVPKLRYTYRDSVTFRCRKGFTLRGHPTSQCQGDRSWHPPVPVCEEDGVAERYHHPDTTTKPVLHCSKPANIAHGSFRGPGKAVFTPGTSVDYICEPGFSLLGTASIYCTASGAWSHPPPLCQAVRCLQPPNITNGRLKGNASATFPSGAAVSYSCDPGYSLVGNAFINCTGSGAWSQPLPQCKEIRCEFPDVQGVKKAIKGNTYRSGTNITLECDDGYTLEGISHTQCQEDFSWDPPVPACKLTSPKSGSVGLGVAAAAVLLLLGAGVVWKIISKQKEGYYRTYENYNYRTPLNPATEHKDLSLP